MFGFLLKLLILVAVVYGGYTYLSTHPTKLQLPSRLSDLKQIELSTLTAQLSTTLDNLVTNKNSPVVLGLQVSNNSVSAVVDFIQKLPPEQVDQLKSVICSPESKL